MKIIFLDIDGVLCTFRAQYAQGHPTTTRGFMAALDREVVGMLNVLCCGVPPEDVRVVIMSNWRNLYDKEYIEQHLRKYGFIGALHDEWSTIALADNGNADAHKGREVAHWLLLHPDVTNWIAIDDRAEMLDDQRDRHIRPDYCEGLSWQNFRQAAKILHGIEGLPAQ